MEIIKRKEIKVILREERQYRRRNWGRPIRLKGRLCVSLKMIICCSPPTPFHNIVELEGKKTRKNAPITFPFLMTRDSSPSRLCCASPARAKKVGGLFAVSAPGLLSAHFLDLERSAEIISDQVPDSHPVADRLCQRIGPWVRYSSSTHTHTQYTLRLLLPVKSVSVFSSASPVFITIQQQLKSQRGTFILILEPQHFVF
jgi:hypothetical protein